MATDHIHVGVPYVTPSSRNGAVCRSSASEIFRNSSFAHSAICWYSLLRPQQRLDGATFVHRAVACRDLVERQREIENLTRIYFSLPYQIDQFWQEAAHGGWAAVKVHMGVEQFLTAELDAVRHADVAD